MLTVQLSYIQAWNHHDEFQKKGIQPLLLLTIDCHTTESSMQKCDL